jgi:hypothetical protein
MPLFRLRWFKCHKLASVWVPSTPRLVSGTFPKKTEQKNYYDAEKIGEIHK